MPHDFMPGLAGVPAAKSAISDVDGQRGVLEYRGIRVEELCQRSSYLETTYLCAMRAHEHGGHVQHLDAAEGTVHGRISLLGFNFRRLHPLRPVGDLLLDEFAELIGGH